MKSILLMFHCEQNTGYAIKSLEDVFKTAAIQSGFHPDNILWSYSKKSDHSKNVFEINYYKKSDADNLQKIIRKHQITTILAFDMPVSTIAAHHAKKAGAKNIISYWGASMSGINTGFKLFLKRIECQLKENSSPDHYIFESIAMKNTGVNGRGICNKKTSVINLGVDTVEFQPNNDKSYIKKLLSIPNDRKVVFYSGHMEERKGIRTIVKSAKYLADINCIENIHFVLCGNKGNEADTYLLEIEHSQAKNHVTFAGYRDDIPELMASSDIGVIASTGWDSFTKSSVEMLASGIPLIASKLGGLSETTEHNVTGELFEPGDYISLATIITKLSNDPERLLKQSLAARKRAIELFSINDQIKKISSLIKNQGVEK